MVKLFITVCQATRQFSIIMISHYYAHKTDIYNILIDSLHYTKFSAEYLKVSEGSNSEVNLLM